MPSSLSPAPGLDPISFSRGVSDGWHNSFFTSDIHRTFTGHAPREALTYNRRFQNDRNPFGQEQIMKREIPASTRSEVRLSPRLDKRLFSYAAAASAAGVSLLAATQSAEAKIVYTAANISIPANTSVKVDINNDGAADFSFYFYAYGPRRVPLGYFDDAVTIDPSKTGNEVWGVLSSKGVECAAALPSGTKVGAGAAFGPNELLLWASAGTAYSLPDPRCKFASLPRGGYLGLKFLINGQTHYGWAHVTVQSSANLGKKAVINGYAYETVPNQAIDAGKTGGPSSISGMNPTAIPVPQPATIGVLAQGAPGLSLWRRPEEEQQPQQRIDASLS
jgi:hypothetical protein